MNILSITHPDATARAARALQAGQLVVLPTDTVYGIAAHPARPEAIIALYAAKKRPPLKALPVLLDSIKAVEQIAQPLTPTAYRLATAFWPGPLTLVVPKRDDLSPLITTLTTVGVRVPNHNATRAIIEAAGGALAVTSANLSDAPDAVTVDAAAAQLGDAVALYLDGGACPGGQPSTVVQIKRNMLKILRQGPIDLDALLATGA